MNLPGKMVTRHNSLLLFVSRDLLLADPTLDHAKLKAEEILKAFSFFQPQWDFSGEDENEDHSLSFHLNTH